MTYYLYRYKKNEASFYLRRSNLILLQQTIPYVNTDSHKITTPGAKVLRSVNIEMRSM
jgi:hypothetical protein